MKLIKAGFLLLFVAFLGTYNSVLAQLSVLSHSFNSYDASPSSLLNITVMNSANAQNIVVVSDLFNSTGDLVMHAKTPVFLVVEGVSVLSGFQLALVEGEFGTSSQGEYARMHRMLPSGYYSLCFQLISEHGEVQSNTCFELASENNTVLHLVSPFDGEVITSPYPILAWFHSEPFSATDQGEFYRIVVCEMIEGMSPEASIDNGIPVFLLDYLSSHQIPYSIEAIPLETGKKYAWEVQKISRNTIIQQTETWQFLLRNDEKQKDIKYAVARKELDGGFYTVINNKLFFRFDEEYTSGTLDCVILSNGDSSIESKPKNESSEGSFPNIKRHGYNRYEIDLDDYNLNKGIHTLRITNSKKEVFYLKFKIG